HRAVPGRAAGRREGVRGLEPAHVRAEGEAAAAADSRHRRRQRLLPAHAEAVRRDVPRRQAAPGAAAVELHAHGARPAGDRAALRAHRGVLQGDALKLEAEFIEDCPYAADALLIDEILEVDREKSMVRVKMPA